MLLYRDEMTCEPSSWLNSPSMTQQCLCGQMKVDDDRQNSARRFGYSLRGIPPVDHRILIGGVRYSAIPVVSSEGAHDVFLAEGMENGSRFEKFVRECLIPVLMPLNQ